MHIAPLKAAPGSPVLVIARKQRRIARIDVRVEHQRPHGVAKHRVGLAQQGPAVIAIKERQGAGHDLRGDVADFTPEFGGGRDFRPHVALGDQ